MKKCFFKIYKNLFLYKKAELKLLAFKICYSKNKKVIGPSMRSYHKSFCCVTGVKRSVYNFFNLARWSLKYLLSYTKIAGLKRISW